MQFTVLLSDLLNAFHLYALGLYARNDQGIVSLLILKISTIYSAAV